MAQRVELSDQGKLVTSNGTPVGASALGAEPDGDFLAQSAGLTGIVVLANDAAYQAVDPKVATVLYLEIGSPKIYLGAVTLSAS